MICHYCTTSNADNARFCAGCGRDLGEIARQSSARQQQSALANQVTDPLLNSTIASKYRIGAKLGAGGMGAVYQATRLVIGDEVAVKILHAEQSDPRAGERFRREAQAAARLKHPNAVTIYDFGITEDGLQYLVMEHVEGQTLRQIIKEQGPLTPTASAEIINQVCAALDEAHRRNIIHRDIKPDNIIVNINADALAVKVLDFGIAKLRDEAAHNLTQTGGIVGTPHYMSPEQCLGEELDSRSDIYSLGVVLYEMLTGQVPFNSPVSSAIVIQHVNQAPPPLRSRNVGILPAVESVVISALEKTRENRPQSAGELAHQFKAAVRDGVAITPRASRPADQTRVDAPQSFAAVSLPATTVLQQPSRSTDVNNGASPKRIPIARLITVVLALLVVGGGVVWLVKRRQENHQSTNSTQLVNNLARAANSISLNFNKNFAGLVGSKFKIEMRLQRNEGELSGSYFFQPVRDIPLHGNYAGESESWAGKSNSLARIDVPIKGTVDTQQNFIVEEFDDKGSKVGIFEGQFGSDGGMEGTWSKPNGKSQTQFSLKEEGDTASGGNYRVVTKLIKKNTGKMKIEISYPQLEGFTDENVQKNFNERVRALVSKDAQVSRDEEGERGVGFSVDHRSGALLSLVFGVYNEWTGAAHGQHYNFSYHYDLNHNKELALSDFFSPGVNHLSLLSKLCAKDIAKQKRKNGMEDIYEDGEAAAFEALEEDATFYPSESGLVFIFDPYQVGSFAEGYYVVRFLTRS